MDTIITKRLILRDWNEGDSDALFLIESNPELTLPCGSNPITDKNIVNEYLEYLIHKKNGFAIVLKESGKVIGSFGLNEDYKEQENVRNIGYILLKEYWNKGYMGEALKAVISEAHKYCDALSTVIYNNPKSEHLLKKNGFKQTDIIKDVEDDGVPEPVDMPYFYLSVK